MSESISSTLVPAQLSFEDQCQQVLGELRTALAQVMGLIPAAPRRAIDLQRTLKLDPPTAWSIFRAATAPDAITSGTFVPTPAKVEKYLNAAARASVPRDPIQRAREAHARFEELIELHAGDRDTFDSMLQDMLSQRTPDLDLKHKKAAFKANGHLHGRRADAVISCSIVFPSETPGFVDSASIRGGIGVRQIRRTGPLSLDLRSKRADDSAPLNRHPITQDSRDESGLGLLIPFCSAPLPKFRTISIDGWSNTSLQFDVVGNTSAATYYIGTVSRAYMPEALDSSHGLFATTMGLPAIQCVRDVIFHESLLRGRRPTVKVYRDVRSNNVHTDDLPQHLLPVQEHLSDLGTGIGNLEIMGVPRYSEVIQFAFEKLSLTPQAFRGFRVQCEYPVMGSVIAIGLE